MGAGRRPAHGDPVPPLRPPCTARNPSCFEVTHLTNGRHLTTTTLELSSYPDAHCMRSRPEAHSARPGNDVDHHRRSVQPFTLLGRTKNILFLVRLAVFGYIRSGGDALGATGRLWLPCRMTARTAPTELPRRTIDGAHTIAPTNPGVNNGQCLLNPQYCARKRRMRPATGCHHPQRLHGSPHRGRPGRPSPKAR